MSGQRFARQYGDEPPPGFPLASPCTGIVRGLSGLSVNALSPIWSTHLRMVMQLLRVSHRSDSNNHLRFPSASEFATQTLACTLNSLVRVSRRDVWVRSRRHPEHLSGSRVDNRVQPSTQVSCLESGTPKGPWLPCRGKCLLPRSKRGYELIHRTPRTVVHTCGAL